MRGAACPRSEERRIDRHLRQLARFAHIVYDPCRVAAWRDALTPEEAMAILAAALPEGAESRLQAASGGDEGAAPEAAVPASPTHPHDD